MEQKVASMGRSQGLSWPGYLAVFGFALAIGGALLARYPVIYGGDPVVRITNWERLRLAYQLPMTQVVVHLATHISPDPIFLRLVLMTIAALGACGMARLAEVAFGEKTGLYAGLLFASNHFLIYLGNSAYQEVLELTLVLWGLSLVFGAGGGPAAPGGAAGYLLLAAACLTRYEAWLVVAAAATVRLIERRPGALGALRIALPFAIGPLAWVVLHGGLSPRGTSLFDPAFRLARLWRVPYVLGATLNHTASAVAVLAVLGAALWYRHPNCRRSPVVATLLLAAILFLLALPLTATGVLPDYDRYVTNREAHFLLPLLFLMAALALDWCRKSSSFRPVVLMLLVIFAYESLATKRIMDQSVSEGNLQLDAALARMLAARLGPLEKALIFARPFPPEELEHFLDIIRRRQGEAGIRAARESMARINNWPFDFARIWVHAPRLRPGLIPAQQALALGPETRIAIVFDDYQPGTPTEQALLDGVRAAAAATERYPPPPLPGRSGAAIYSVSPSGAGSR